MSWEVELEQVAPDQTGAPFKVRLHIGRKIFNLEGVHHALVANALANLLRRRLASIESEATQAERARCLAALTWRGSGVGCTVDDFIKTTQRKIEDPGWFASWTMQPQCPSCGRDWPQEGAPSLCPECRARIESGD